MNVPVLPTPALHRHEHEQRIYLIKNTELIKTEGLDFKLIWPKTLPQLLNLLVNQCVRPAVNEDRIVGGARLVFADLSRE